MKLAVVGINHRTAPVEMRERLAVAGDRMELAVRSLAAIDGVLEGVLLSTCNRVEAYAVFQDEPPASGILGFLGRHGGVAPDALQPHLFVATGEDTVRHLIRVVAGLDSMVLGESEIAAQAKAAYAAALQAGTTGAVLNPLFQQAFRAAKRIQTDTGISEGRISVPSVGVALVKRVFEDLADKTVLVVGAGEMGRLTVECLRHEGAERILVTSRTAERARALVQDTGGGEVPWESLDHYLSLADVLVCATAAPGLILDAGRVREAMRKRRHRSTLVLDLAVPRDVDPGVRDIDGLYLYDIDDLSEVVNRNLERRRHELERADRIVAEEVSRFRDWHDSRGVEDAIGRIHRYAQDVRERELGKTLARLGDLSEAQRAEVQSLAHRLAGRLAARPIEALRREYPGRSGGGSLLDAAARLFAEPPQGPGSGGPASGAPVSGSPGAGGNGTGAP